MRAGWPDWLRADRVSTPTRDAARWIDSDVPDQLKLILTIAGLAGTALLLAPVSGCLGWALVGIAAGLGLSLFPAIGKWAQAPSTDGQGNSAENLLSRLQNAVIRLDLQGHINYANTSAKAMLGLLDGDDGDGWQLIDHQTRADLLENLLARTARQGLIRIPDGTRLVSRHGLESEVEGSCQPLRDASAQIEAYLLVLRDVTEEREWRRQQPDLWDRDPVSALPGRNFMENRLNQALQNKRSSDLPLTYLRVTLTGIQQVYEGVDETAGDALVRHLAALLRAHVRDTDLIARLDERSFGILLTHCPPEISQRITAGIRIGLGDFHFEWQGQSHAVEARIGQADVPPFEGSLDELLAVVKANSA